jgi:hypothetical protein
MIVRAQSRDWTRLQPKKADLARWRQEFAERLMERSVAAVATRRQSRGVIHPSLKLRDYHRDETAKKWPMRPGIAARWTEKDVKVAWQSVARALNSSADPEDRELAQKIGEFTGSMQTAAREANRAQERKNQIEREMKQREKERQEKERQRLVAASSQAQPERQLRPEPTADRERQGPLR